ncbi:hypothetical protein PENTCL1PPCAC_9126, partial [Pristionchus entomophagus]
TVQFSVLLALLILSSAVSGGPVCEWLGSGVFCGSWDWAEGTTKITRMTTTYTPWAEFGFWDCWTGENTLCCKNSVVRGDPKKRCGVTAARTSSRQNSVDGKGNWSRNLQIV